MRQTGISKEKGSVLVMAVVLSFAIFVLGLSYLASVDNLSKLVSEEVRDVQNIYGLTHGSVTNAAVQNGGQYPGSYGSWNEFIDERGWYRNRVSFSGSFEDEGLFYGTARGYLVLTEVMTEFPGAANPLIRRSIRYEILETFADYLYLSDCEEDPVRNDRIRFWGPDTLDGKVHSNDTIHVQLGQGSWPCFKKKVTSCAPYVVPFNNQATFEEGFYPNAESIYFPDQADEIRRKSYIRNLGTWDPDSVTELTFNGEDIFYRYCGPGNPPYQDSLICNYENISTAPHFRVPPASGALFVNGKVFIKANRGHGDLMDPYFVSDGFEGRLTVASSDTMIIYDNLIYKYANDDKSVPTDIDDCLGLISESAIMVGDSVGDTVYINAALASIGGTISVRDIYDYGSAGNPNDNVKQSLFIYGSLAMRNRGIVHTTYENWGERGFIEKDYHYDTRLQMDPPPHFIRAREHNSVYVEVISGG
jgi:hypothetical protein